MVILLLTNKAISTKHKLFLKMLQYVKNNGKSCVMKEKETKNGLRLLITFIRIDSVKTALHILNKI